MNIYLRGYYGYKNFGDELLLLGLLPYLEKRYGSVHITIQTPNIAFLSSWIEKNSDILSSIGYTGTISYMKSIPMLPRKNSLLVLGGGEVLTDARSFPYNGWNYFIKNFFWFLSGATVFVGGIGNTASIFTSLLYRILFFFSKETVVRDPDSHTVASKYTKKIIQYHDFAYDVLGKLDSTQVYPHITDYSTININRHILTGSLAPEIKSYFEKELRFGQKIYFVPASVGSDDADSDLFTFLSGIFDGIEMYDWTQKSLSETISFLLGSNKNLATRLHITLIFAYYQKPFKPLIYQEKVQRMLDSIDVFRDSV